MRIKLLILVLTALTFACSNGNSVNKEKVTDFVNPFIGTGGHGHTYPGAALPFGMVQLSPDNPSRGWDWTSGYNYSDSIILGFSHTHLSGTGIGDLYDILLMPFNGDYPKNTVNEYKRVYAKFRHDNEVAKPGYYKVKFNNGIETELTVSKRCGFHKYKFKGSKNKILLDLGYAQNWDTAKDTYIKVIDNNKIEGFRISSGWAKYQPVYFYMEFSEPFEVSLYKDKKRVYTKEVRGEKTEAVFLFDKNDVMVKVGISSASIEGAKKNIEVELNNKDFEQVKEEAEKTWEKLLSRVEIKSKNISEKRKFYTALYHSFLAPTLFSDANGEYYGANGKIMKADGYDRYTLFSLWDTFRALHPLLTIVYPEIVDNLCKSMIGFYEEKGFLPTWDLQNNETDVMIGYHAVPVLVDAYLKGLTTVPGEKILEASIKSATQKRFGINLYEKYGYIPSELELEAVSKTLEYAYDDWCIAQLAKNLGNKAAYIEFSKRAGNYKNLFDKSTGFMRGKDKYGNWVKNFDPTYVEHRKTDYTEANAWQYTWHVLHDPKGLIELMGGEEKFVKKLDSLFTISSQMKGEELSPDISGLIGQYAHGNEPCHHVAYLFSLTNRKDLGDEKINFIKKHMYKDSVDGLVGNDDCGQMSAWYVFSALGFYPLNPSSGEFVIGTPSFEEVKIYLSNGNNFKIIAENLSDKNIYVDKVKINEKELSFNILKYEQIMKGGILKFQMKNNNK